MSYVFPSVKDRVENDQLNIACIQIQKLMDQLAGRQEPNGPSLINALANIRDSDFNAKTLRSIASRALDDQAVENVLVNWSNQKPVDAGKYLVRGFDAAKTEAMVDVAYDEDFLVCNLHNSNSEPVSKYGTLMSDMNKNFEWANLYTHPASTNGPNKILPINKFGVNKPNKEQDHDTNNPG